MATAKPQRRIGRPPLSETVSDNLSNLASRRTEILEAATSAFLEYGYERTTLSHIIERVGGSNRTLYAMFGDKAGLFTAVVEHVSSRKMLSLGVIQHANVDLRETLLLLGKELCVFAHSPLVLQLHRILVSSMDRFPDTGLKIYRAVAAPTLAVLVEVFGLHAANHSYRMKSYEEMAKYFVAVMQRDFERRILKVATAVLSDAEMDDYVREGVDFFLAGAITG